MLEGTAVDGWGGERVGEGMVSSLNAVTRPQKVQLPTTWSEGRHTEASAKIQIDGMKHTGTSRSVDFSSTIDIIMKRDAS